MKTEESLSINIEQSDDEEYSITDYEVIMNTGETGSSSALTPLFNCELCALIVDSDKRLRLTITLAKYPGVVLFDADVWGQSYIPLRVDTFNKDFERFNFQNSKWILNDELILNIKGDMNSTIKIVLRYE